MKPATNIEEHFENCADEYDALCVMEHNAKFAGNPLKQLVITSAQDGSKTIIYRDGVLVETTPFNHNNWYAAREKAFSNGVEIQVLDEGIKLQLKKEGKSLKEDAFKKHDEELVEPAFQKIWERYQKADGSRLVIIAESGDMPRLLTGDVVKIRSGFNGRPSAIGMIADFENAWHRTEGYSVNPVPGMPSSPIHAWFHITDFEKVILGPIHTLNTL